ncbi:MAG: histidine kinase, partial [Herminiimonas sp.]|nr:histidine kinase [Herminiimonas sp.]
MVQSSKRWKVKPSLEMLLSNLPGMVYRCLNDEFWSMEFVSAGACRLTGYQPEEFLGEHRARYRDLVHRDDRERVAQEVQAALRADHSFQLTYRISTADRQQKWVWEQGNGIRDEKGNFYALEGYITDISYRMQAEEALRESEERLRLVTQATTDVIWDWDLGSDRIWWSPGVQNMYGFSYAEVNSGKAWTNHIAPEERERVRNRILAVIK